MNIMLLFFFNYSKWDPSSCTLTLLSPFLRFSESIEINLVFFFLFPSIHTQTPASQLKPLGVVLYSTRRLQAF